MIVYEEMLIIYLIISFLMVFVYAIFVVNAYVSIKYEVETIDNDVIKIWFTRYSILVLL